MKQNVQLTRGLAIFCVLYSLVFLFKIPRLLLDSQSNSFYVTSIFYMILFVLGLYIFRDDFRQQLAWMKQNVLKSIFILIIGYLFYMIVELIGGLLYSWLSDAFNSSDIILQNDSNIMNAIKILPPVFAFFIMSLAGPAVEEMFYRRFLISTLIKYIPPWLSILLSSLLFAVLHVSSFQASEFFNVLPHFFMGIAMGIIYYKTNNLIYPILIHVFNNFSALLPQFL